MSLIDRFATELDKLGKKAEQALDEGKLRIELARERRRMDNAARDLGYVTYKQAKGEPPSEGHVEALTRRIAEAEAEVARIEAEIARVKGDGQTDRRTDGRRGSGEAGGTEPPKNGTPGG